MDKINCVEDYFIGTRAYYLFKLGQFYNKPDYMDFILDKRNLNGAKVSCLSNIMLGMKEDLVDTLGAMNYKSKVFVNSLESSVNFVATKVDDGYKIGNYVFQDAATLVAIVRNKLAHGKYKIDFDHNRVILEHKGVDIVINIEKLINFIVMGFRNTMRDTKCERYERNLVYLTKNNPDRTNKINDIGEVKRILKNYNYLSFVIETTNGMPVPYDCISMFEAFMQNFGRKNYTSLNSQNYKDLVSYLKKRNFKINYEYKKLKDVNEINRICRFASSEIVGNDNLNFNQQLLVLGMEVEKSINNKHNTFNAIVANVNNLIELSAISKMNSVKREDISSYMANHYPEEIKSSYDEYGMILISMFNSLFMYPYDDVFETSGEYKINRDSSFDFSDLDLSMVKPTIINIDESPLVNVIDRCNSLVKKQSELSQKLSVQQSNLAKVNVNSVAYGKINTNINDIQNMLSLIMTEYMKTYNEYNAIKNDYTVNRLYFENRAIIEGIRNAIAHGNYEFISNGSYFDTIIVFKDIYEGKNTFQVEITFDEFEDMINKNYDVVLDYVRNKMNSKSR